MKRAGLQTALATISLAAARTAGYAPSVPEIAEDAADQNAMLGRVLDGRYRIDALLGEGGLGQVFRATDRRLTRAVAIKVMHAHLVARPDLRARFEREARSLGALSHPNVVGVVDYGVEGDLPFLVMEFLEGRTLEAAIGAGIPPARVIPIVRDVLRAVAYAHSQGLVHRDLKPANVFLQAVPEVGDVVRVLDFGLAKFIDAELGGPALTRAGMVLGTPAYMSPEQATGGEVDARTDVYALGIVLYEMATSERPFAATEGSELLKQHLLEEIPRLTGRLDREIHPALDALVRRATAKSRGDRFGDGKQMAAAIDALPADAIRSGGGVGSPSARTSNDLQPAAHALEETLAALPDPLRTLISRPSERPGAAPKEIERESETTPKTRPESTLNELPRARETAPMEIRRSSSPWRGRIALGGVVLALIVGLRIWSLEGSEPGPSLAVDRPPAAPAAPVAGTAHRAASPEVQAPAREEPPAAAPVQRPFDAPTPAQLTTIEARVREGREITPDQRRTLFRYAGNHPRDPRAWLLMGHSDLGAGARTDACTRYQRAFASDEAAREDPTMLHDLLVMVGHHAVTSEASRMVVEIYGARALPELEVVLTELGQDRDATRRLHALERRLEPAR